MVTGWERLVRWLLPGGAVLACLLVAVGCATPEARQEVLTFFFTGVPDPDEISQTDDLRTLSPAERREAMRRARARANFREPTLYAHGPAAADECTVCHKPVSGRESDTRRIGPHMVAAINQLCTSCHDDKDRAFAESLSLVAHPVAGDGRCVLCHDPHRSGLEFMLKGDEPSGTCRGCHAEGKVAGAPGGAVHRTQTASDCIECHNPHFGKTSRLLRADLDEWQLYDMDLAGHPTAR